MAITSFDTLEFVETLEASGFTKEQSKGMVGAFKKAQDDQLKELATKGDTAIIKSELILIKWMLAMVIAATVLPALKTLLG
ncbi:MAG: CCDC90 family protein [Magnetococcus sp. DMHC-1]|nr:hypothetical protein [Magnetococcales bacterium]